MTTDEILEWLRVQLSGAEKALRCRIDMDKAWRGGTDKAWESVGCNLPKSERVKLADTHRRISAKCAKDVEMFKAVIKRLK